jgi:KUP system potassium uptake protein
MILWFLSLSASGIASIMHALFVMKALNPYYALRFLLDNGIAGFFVLSEVFLCATGGEALYADMGHLGRKPIVKAWYFVFAALLLNYFGQGAFLIEHPNAKSTLFEMISHQTPMFYVPFLILSIFATVIASQAMISGMFSIVYQGITTHILPMFKIEFTSTELRSQIYIGLVNWFLLISVLIVMYIFRESHRLAAAYGLAVTGTMTLTGIMMTWIFRLRKKNLLAFISLLLTVIDVTYLLSNSYKIPHGGYWSLIIGTMPFLVIMLYTKGQKRLYRKLKAIPLGEFLQRFSLAYRTMDKLKGTALFFLKDPKEIPPFMIRSMFVNNILYEDNILVTIIKRDDPFGVTGFFKEDPGNGLRVFEIQTGYMEVPDVEEILKEAGIEEKTIFYGLEDIVTDNILWKIFSIIKRLNPSFVQFYKLPSHKLHGVMTRVEI